MSTIQIRDIPENAYEVMRLRAKAQGQSIQAYMRALVIDLASRPTKREAMVRLERDLAEWGGIEIDTEQVLEDLRADRR